MINVSLKCIRDNLGLLAMHIEDRQEGNNKEWIQKFKETGNSRYIHQNELDKVCFQYDMVYEDYIEE